MKEQERTEEMTCDRCSDALDVAEICTFCQGEFCSKCLVEHVCLTAESRVWSLPAEPGPEVTRLRDKDGDT